MPNASSATSASASEVATIAPSARQLRAHSRATGNISARCGFTVTSPSSTPASTGRERRQASARPAQPASHNAFWPLASTTAIPGKATPASHAPRGSVRNIAHAYQPAPPARKTEVATPYGSRPKASTNSRKVGGYSHGSTPSPMARPGTVASSTCRNMA
ncbi:hypothetical protein D3C72_1112290 [compost metagenome]